MRINEAAAAVGITKKNIRYYESEGLLSPGRESGNRYRDYSPQDLRSLQIIKLLRMIDVPIADIKAVLQGQMTLPDSMRRHQITLQARQKDLAAAMELCAALGGKAGLDEVDPAALEQEVAQHKRKGVQFVNVQNSDRKRRYLGAALGAGLGVALFALIGAMLIWAVMYESDPMPVWMFVFMFALVVAGGLCIVAGLVQRVKEIKGGEQDAYRNY